MKSLLTFLFFLLINVAHAQLDMSLPMDSGAIDAANGVTGRLNQLDQSTDGNSSRDQQRQEEEEFNENDYGRPSDEEFNRNWDQEAQSVDLPDTI